MYHIILFFSVAALFLIMGIIRMDFEPVLWAMGFMMLGIIAVASYNKNTKASSIFTNKWVLLGVKLLLGIAYAVIAIVRDDPKQFIWSAIWFGSAVKGLISDNKQARAVVAPVTVQAVPIAEQIPAVKVIIDDFPDKPQPFGYKSSWLCIKGTTPEQVISALGLKNSIPANWASGMAQLRDKVFVSPVVRGYVLVIGYNTFQGGDADSEIEVLAAAAKNFAEMQCFATHRVVDFHTWAKFVDGELVRAYGWLGESGEVYLNQGDITSEEDELGFDGFIQSDDDDWDSVEFPDEELVIEIAAAWGVDPMFSDGDYEYGVGYLCDK